ncbi:MAG: hypothetical protein WD883_00475, partial [Candidatus Colwellbacteria bacterium]
EQKSLETFRVLYEAYWEDKQGEPMQDNLILPIMRGAYSNYIAYFISARHGDEFINTMEQAKTIERIAAEVQSGYVENLNYPGSPALIIEELERGLRVYREGGWEAVGISS